MDSKTTHRFTIRSILDADCTSYSDDRLAGSDNIRRAFDLAAENSFQCIYGCCVVDEKTGAVFWSSGDPADLADNANESDLDAWLRRHDGAFEGRFGESSEGCFELWTVNGHPLVIARGPQGWHVLTGTDEYRTDAILADAAERVGVAPSVDAGGNPVCPKCDRPF